MEGTQKKIGWEQPLVGGQLSLCPRAGERGRFRGNGEQPAGPPPALLSTCRSPGLGAGGAVRFALRAAAGAIRDETLRGLRPSLLPAFVSMSAMTNRLNYPPRPWF